MSKLNDKQRKQIIAESAEGSSQRALARKYGVSATTIRRTLNGDIETAQIVARKKEENTREVLAFMDSRKNKACTIIDNLLNAIDNPEKLSSAPVNQLAVTLGIVIDKFGANEAKADSRGIEDLTPLAELLGDKNDSN